MEGRLPLEALAEDRDLGELLVLLPHGRQHGEVQGQPYDLAGGLVEFLSPPGVLDAPVLLRGALALLVLQYD